MDRAPKVAGLLFAGLGAFSTYPHLNTPLGLGLFTFSCLAGALIIIPPVVKLLTSDITITI